MLGWLVMLGLIGAGFFVSFVMSARWGRGSMEGMSTNMEAENASYHGRTTQFG